MVRVIRERGAVYAELLAVVALTAAICLLLDRASAEGNGGTGVVFVQVPAGTRPSLGAPGSFRDPHPPGSRVCLLELGRAGEEPRILSAGFAAAGSPVVSPSGTAVLFSGKGVPGDEWACFEVDLRTGKIRRVTPVGFNALHPDYLAGDRIVFSADLHGTPDPYDAGASLSLYTCELDGSALERITFNPGSDIDPTVLGDGRVLYSAWQPSGPDRPGGGWGLFTVRKDGTGIFPFFGSHGAPAWERNPVELEEGRVAFVAVDEAEGEVGLRSVALRRPLRSLEVLAVPGFRSPLSISDWRDGSSVLSLVPTDSTGAPGATAGVYVVGAGDDPAPQLLFDDPSMDELDAVAVRSRPQPRGLVSDTRPGAETGTLLCLDARRTDRIGSPSSGLPAASVRIYRGDAQAGGIEGDARRLLAQELVIEIGLASDGSFLAEVPADVPLRFETVDESGNVLLDSKGWVWVRPGEQRSCIGCHEDRETAPPNRLPEALSRELRPAVGKIVAIGGAE